MGNYRHTLYHLRMTLRYIKAFITRMDAVVLRLPYARCLFTWDMDVGGCTAYGKLSSPSFESMCSKLRVGIPSFQVPWTPSGLCRWYMSRRLRWETSVWIETADGSIQSFGKLSAQSDLKLAKDYLTRDLKFAVTCLAERTSHQRPQPGSGPIVRGRPAQAKPRVPDAAAPEKKAERMPPGGSERPAEAVRLVFGEAGRQALQKEKDEQDLLIKRMTAKQEAGAAAGPPPEVESFVLGLLKESVGGCLRKSDMALRLKESFNNPWADAVVEQINERHWPLLRGTLITSDDSKYYLDKKHFNTISHE